VVTLTIVEKWDEMLNEMIRLTYAKGGKIGKFMMNFTSPVGAAIEAGKMIMQGADALGPGQPRANAAADAQAKFNKLLEQLAPKPQPKPPEPQLPIPQANAGQAGLLVANAIGDMIADMKGNAAPVMAGVNQMLANTQLKGFFALNAISSMFGGGATDGEQKQQARHTATALQRGSAEAYSAIVQAMSGAKDPVVKAVDKQTKALGEPLKQMANVLIKAKPLEVIGNLFGGE
jgi:hypothetical protein